MVFIGGPRQVDKTTLSKALCHDQFAQGKYFNWDSDEDRREVDFVTLINGKIIDLIEVKSSDTTISSNLKYYSERLKPKNTVQIVGELKRSFHQDHILVTNPFEFFKNPAWDGI